MDIVNNTEVRESLVERLSKLTLEARAESEKARFINMLESVARTGDSFFIFEDITEYLKNTYMSNQLETYLASTGLNYLRIEDAESYGKVKYKISWMVE